MTVDWIEGRLIRKGIMVASRQLENVESFTVLILNLFKPFCISM